MKSSSNINNNNKDDLHDLGNLDVKGDGDGIVGMIDDPKIDDAEKHHLVGKTSSLATIPNVDSSSSSESKQQQPQQPQGLSMFQMRKKRKSTTNHNKNNNKTASGQQDNRSLAMISDDTTATTVSKQTTTTGMYDFAPCRISKHKRLQSN